MVARRGPRRWFDPGRFTKAVVPIFILVVAGLGLVLFASRPSSSPDPVVTVVGLGAYLTWAFWAAEQHLSRPIVVSGLIVSAASAVAFFFAGFSIAASLVVWLALIVGIPWTRSWVNWF